MPPEQLELVQNDESKTEIESSFILEVDELQNHGINASDINKLKNSGIFTIKAIQMTTKRNLAKIKGLSETKIEKVKEVVGTMMGSGFITGIQYAIKRECIKRITTGSSEFDKLLGGGIQTMSITEAFGEFRTGKTQIAHTLCVTSQLPKEMGGGEGKVGFIDSEGTFRPDRIRQIANRFDLDGDKVLENIFYARAYNSEQQMDFLTELSSIFMEDKTFAALIIDSVISLFRTDYCGRGELSERQQKLNAFLSKLMKLGEEFNLAVYITNQMSSDPGATLTFTSDPKKPVGGHVLAHASTTRLSLKKGKGEERIVKIYDSPDMPEAEARYSIDESGIIDCKD